MTNAKATKRALISSVLALLLCFTMLLGTTFAWFTDSVASKNNIIKAGNLDIELYYQVEGQTDWTRVTDTSNIFKEGALWEPGHTEVVRLKAVNEGTLALKYQLGVNVASETGSINIEGKPFKLSDYIMYGIVDGTKAYTRDTAIEAVKDNATALSEAYASGFITLDAKNDTDSDEKIVTLVVYMPESVGNEANAKTGADTPTIALGINVMATQVAAESDSFSNDYDANAAVSVAPGESISAAIAKVEDGGIVVLESGVHNLASGPIVVEGKEVTIVGVGDVTINKNYGNTHIFTISNGANVTIENVTMDGKGNTREGVYVRWNSKVTLKNVAIKNTGGKDVMIDEASDAAHGEKTASYVWLVNSHIEDVAMCASPVMTVSATQDTFVYFNYDANSTVGSIDVQSINKKPENIIINGVSATEVGTTMYFNVTNDAELAAALQTIKTNEAYWNKEVIINMAAGEYSADHVINQYPQWNGEVGAGSTPNNYASGVPAGAPNTVITFVGETVTTYSLRGAQTVPTAIFTGNVTVKGFGNAGAGFGSATAVTTFKNVGFDGTNSADNAEDSVVMYVKAAANNVNFEGCVFKNATHVTLGGSAADGVGSVNVDGCTFNDGGCLSGYVETLNVANTVVTAAKNGFINKSKAGNVTVENCEINAGKYFIRTSNSGVHLTVEDSDITMYESDGSKHLVYFRGSNESAKFVDCTIADGYTTAGVDTESTLAVYNYTETDDGLTLVTDGITDEVTLYLVPADYEGTTVNVPEGVDTIGNFAFKYNSNVETVILPSTVTDLGRGFDESTVKKVVLNEGLTTISSRAFRSTTALEEVVIPSTVTEIADNAFQKSGIKEIVIPANVKTIGETAFGASLIEKVTFEGDIAIQGYAFRGCTKLNTVVMNGYNVTFVKSTLNGRNSMWFCNGESNNPNTSNITFYVKTPVIKDRVLTAMGAEKDNTVVICELNVPENEEFLGYYVDDKGNAITYDATGLVAALENGKDVVMVDDTKINPAGMSNSYGTTGINVKNGQTIDGNGNTLDIKGAGGTWDSGINTTGGLIKNIIITGSFRGIFINHNSEHVETVVLENVIIDGTTYTISCDQGKNQNLEAYNSTFNGWTSYAATLGTAKFTDCSFGEGNGYAYCRPYAPTTFVGCNFEAGYVIDPRADVVFENCTFGGVALTEANIADLVSNTAKVTVK